MVCGQNLLFLAARNRLSSSQVYAEECRVIEKIGDRITGGRDSTDFAEPGRFYLFWTFLRGHVLEGSLYIYCSVCGGYLGSCYELP